MRWTFLLSLAAAVTLAAGKVTTNARCGHAYNALPGGMTCKGSRWGDCCSQYGYCGKTKDYCGNGCQSSFGNCNGVVTPAHSSSTSSRSSTSTGAASSTAPSSSAVNVKVTTNARCGNLYGASPAGMTCSGGRYGDCCSQYSYCGSSSAYCGTGCQPGFGKCNAVPPRSTASSSTLSSSTLSSSTLSTSSSSSASSSSVSSSTPTPVSISSTSETITSTSSSESLSSDSSTSSPISSSSSASSEISTTSTSSTLTTSSSATSPSPTAEKYCGIEGYDVVNLQVISAAPFTTVDACAASCRAQSACGSFIVYSNTCYLAQIPITSTNVVPTPNSGIMYYNPDCGASPLTTTTPPTTSTTSITPTPTSTTTTSTVCVPPAPTVSCVKYPDCPKFTSPLSNSCPANGAQCKDNYFVRCENIPAAGSQVLLTVGGIPNADVCAQRCDGLNNCSAFAFKAGMCMLYSSVNGFISDSATTFIRICPVETCDGKAVRRDGGSDGGLREGVGSVSIEMWENGA